MSARRLWVVRGTPEQTAAAARAAVGDAAVLWVDDAASARAALGTTVDAAVVSLHEALDPDLLGQVQGAVVAGGALVLRLPPAGAPAPGRARLAAWPYGPDDVGQRFWARLQRWAAQADPWPAAPLRPQPRPAGGTAEQARLVDALAATLGGEAPARVVVTADRGRGKSSALGLALARCAGRRAITAASPAAAAEGVRFGGVPYLEPEAALAEDLDVLVVDEAAQLSVPLLQRLVARHPRARLAFATTVRGYEGTGRGFALRFCAWLAEQPVALQVHALTAPIRFDPDDPLERALYSLLALDAEPGPAGQGAGQGATLDRDRLAADEAQLRALFGLLVHAHYRTTPADLHRLLDAPNLAVHALLDGPHPVAASLVAAEGGLPRELAERLVRGERLVGHALPETLAVHLGHPDAATLRMWRSVRTAAHPDRRGEGLGSALVAHVHAAATAADPPLDLLGTVFGATPALLRWRRAQGYALVRVGVSRGSRTGEPAAVMLRPLSPPAHALLATLRAELARDLPDQLALFDGDGLDPALRAALVDGLPPPAPFTEAAVRDAVEGYVFGARPLDAAVAAVRHVVLAHPEALDRLPPSDRALIRDRVVDGWTGGRWRCATGPDAAAPTVPAVMRALRRAGGPCGASWRASRPAGPARPTAACSGSRPWTARSGCRSET
ncbi:MAG: GNAT family N-acetyltransferase [Myxococcota bacterium]